MIKLFQFPSKNNLPNFSPFCAKLETYMRMAKIPFEIVSISNPRSAPKGKLPYIIDTDNKLILADSHFIIEYLKDKYGDILDGHLTPKERGIALALEHMLDEHLYWVIVYSRWIDPRGWATIHPLFFKKIPLWLRFFVPQLLRYKVRRALFHQGLGRHHADEVYALGIEDLESIAAILGDKDYLLSNTPSGIDASCYACLSNILSAPFENPLTNALKNLPKLVSYCMRMQQRFYPENL